MRDIIVDGTEPSLKPFICLIKNFSDMPLMVGMEGPKLAPPGPWQPPQALASMLALALPNNAGLSFAYAGLDKETHKLKVIQTIVTVLLQGLFTIFFVISMIVIILS